jgi:4-hydroxybenzoate polyprenyltransferase
MPAIRAAIKCAVLAVMMGRLDGFSVLTTRPMTAVQRHCTRLAVKSEMQTTDPLFDESFAPIETTVNGKTNMDKRELNGSLKTIWSYRDDLWKITRPNNLPVIFGLHLLGTHLTLGESTSWITAITAPAWWLTFVCIGLVSSTSMLVNDYYDAKLGRDADSSLDFIKESLPLPVVKQTLMYLYGGTLMLSTLLPGALTRALVVVSLILTYLYTVHLKPIPWVKNAVCATLVAASPWASGSTIVALANGPTTLLVPSLARFVAALWFSIVGREMIMDCTDVENDKRAGVNTVPVQHGVEYASRVALGATLMSAVATLWGPLHEIGQIGTSLSAQTLLSPAMRHLMLAGLGSGLMVLRHLQVVQSKGQDMNTIDKAIKEGHLSALLIMLSFI